MRLAPFGQQRLIEMRIDPPGIAFIALAVVLRAEAPVASDV
jgi:hypothetical protein